MLLTVYTNKKEALFTGTKEECYHFIKRRQLNRAQIIITDAAPKVKTTSPIESKPTGFLKRIFKK